jgi:hypothetical protein
MKDKWQALLKTLEIESGSYLHPCDENKITEFEAKFGITLPSEYKLFCQVFGSVSFGNEVYIGCADFNIESQRDLFREILTGWSKHEGYKDFDNNLEKEAYDKICELVEHGMRFGGTPINASDFWFDLRTYGLDESYDIYYVSTGDEFAIVKLPERNFFDFVREYCLGTKLYDPVSMPENMVIQSEQHEFFVTDETGAG